MTTNYTKSDSYVAAPKPADGEYIINSRPVYVDNVASITALGEQVRNDRQGGNYRIAAEWMRPITALLANEQFYWKVEPMSCLDNGQVAVSIYGQPPFGQLFRLWIRPMAGEEMMEVEWPSFIESQSADRFYTYGDYMLFVRRLAEHIYTAAQEIRDKQVPHPINMSQAHTVMHDQAKDNVAWSYTGNNNGMGSMAQAGMIRS